MEFLHPALDILVKLRGQAGKIVQGQALAADIFRKAASVQRRLNGGFFAVRERGGKAVCKGFPPQKKRAVNDLEEKRLVIYVYGRPLPPDAAQHGGMDFRPGLEAVGRHIEKDFRFHVVLQKEGKRAAIPRALRGRQALGDFFLKEHRNAFKTGDFR